MIGQFGDVQQTFKPVLKPNKHTKVRDLGDFAGDLLARRVTLRDFGSPWIFVHLLQAQRDAASIGVDGENTAGKLLAFLQHFVWMADLASPRHIRNVQQSIDAFF